MAVKIATRTNSIEGGSKLRGRLPGGFEAGLQSLARNEIFKANLEASLEAGLEASLRQTSRQASRQASKASRRCF